jgi:hypothetical protein
MYYHWSNPALATGVGPVSQPGDAYHEQLFWRGIDMKRRFWFVPVVLCMLAIAAACGKSTPTPPASPSAAIPGDANANPDGSTLKATAPTPQSPMNGARLEGEVRLTVGNSSMKFATGIPLAYRFEVYNAAGNRVYQSGLVPAGSGSTSHIVEEPLEPDQTYSWQSRPEYLGTAGPWSPRNNATFIAPNLVGFRRGMELYDPLVGGQTKFGSVFGPHQWIPGVGLKLLSLESHVVYELEQTCDQCEMSVILTNLFFNTEGGKTKIMSMSQGYSDIITNDRRLTVEKRGDPPGTVAWRIITHGDQVDTEGREREVVQFFENHTYLWEASWRNNFFNVRIFDGTSPASDDIYEKGKHFGGRPYDPSPHVAFLGAPVGRSGPDGASVPDVIYRHLWISPNPRPAYANR